MKYKRIIMILVLFLFSLPTILSLQHTAPPQESEVDFLIDNWDGLPFKHQRANLTWVDYVNANLAPNHTWITTGYDENNEKTAEKCLSYGASTTIDWFKLMIGAPFGSYQNFVNNKTEGGINPRELEVIYRNKIERGELYAV